ncbi:MAG: type II toxin-antitoxin system RelB/DinJ family antitoxin [Candidatus Brocadiaceae bacterium]|nr:type II toxin-antitoxin system RelB/DinJ family antitoxin [Candidatus Brocadiaceae bacterium]
MKKLGMSHTEAIRIFYNEIYLRGALPFTILIPNEITKKTLGKSRRGEGVQFFDSLGELSDSQIVLYLTTDLANASLSNVFGSTLHFKSIT